MQLNTAVPSCASNVSLSLTRIASARGRVHTCHITTWISDVPIYEVCMSPTLSRSLVPSHQTRWCTWNTQRNTVQFLAGTAWPTYITTYGSTYTCVIDVYYIGLLFTRYIGIPHFDWLSCGRTCWHIWLHSTALQCVRWPWGMCEGAGAVRSWDQPTYD